MFCPPRLLGQMAHVTLILGITCCTLTPATILSSGHSDAVSMIQVAVNADNDDFDTDPFWVQMKSDPETKSFDEVPVFKASRIRSGSMSPRNQWIVVYPQEYTHDQLMIACRQLVPPATCDHVSHPEKGELAFTSVHAYENELRESGMHKSSANNFRAKYIQVDGPTHLFGSRESVPVPWGLDRIDQDVGTDGKYDVSSLGGFGTHVYHFDTGVNSDLSEFAIWRSERLWDITQPDRSCPQTVSKWCGSRPSGDCSTKCAMDTQGHGSHTAGTICGRTYGVAKAAVCHSMKVLNDEGTGAWSWFAEALNEVIGSGYKPSIVSASLGGPGLEPSIKDVIDKALDKNIVVVVAAGNEQGDACFSTPGFVESAFVVGSTDKNDRISSFSNYGKCVDIYAPGSNIPSVNHLGEVLVASGTSMAAPHVAGACALKLGFFSKAQEIVDEVTDVGTKVRILSGQIKLLRV